MVLEGCDGTGGHHFTVRGEVYCPDVTYVLLAVGVLVYCPDVTFVLLAVGGSLLTLHASATSHSWVLEGSNPVLEG